MRGGLVTFGEAMGLVSAVETGPLESARNFSLTIGGAEANVAIGAARLGANVTWFGRVGPDATGDLLERRLQAEQVHTLAIRDNAFTGLMIKHRRFGATLQVDYHRAGSAGSLLAPPDIPRETLRRADILHVTGITPALSDSARATVFDAVAMARESDVRVSLDINYRAKLWPREAAAPVLRELAGLADIVFAGVEEARLVIGHDHGSAAELARELATLGPVEAIIKDGPRGCAASIDGTAHELAAIPVAVVDPVGAGDAFVAGYLAERLAGRDAIDRLSTAIAAGAFAVTVPGDCEGLPRRQDLALVHQTDDVAR
jgi:2-dehydro-3-deoxygluconokinase